MPEPLPASHRLRTALHQLSWWLWLPFGLLGQIATHTRARAWRPLMRVGLSALGLGLATALWVGLPVAWSHLKFTLEAPPLVRKPSTDEALQAALQRLAARSGLIHPLPSPQAFVIQHASRGTFEARVVTFRFPQELTLFGQRLGECHLSGTVQVARPDEPEPAPTPGAEVP